MTIRAVCFDFGGVLVRTEDRAPRARLAESLGLTSREIEKVVFENESSAQASTGAIPYDQHWRNVIHALGLPESEITRLRDEFFSGDRVDEDLIAFLRGLRPSVKVGLISNAWSDLRTWLTDHKIADLFDAMIISAEVGLVKPDARIFHLALDKLGVAPNEAVFVDDMPANVDGARAAGMHAIQFTQSRALMDELKRMLANHR